MLWKSAAVMEILKFENLIGFYRPLARRWECSQSGGQNNKISIPRRENFICFAPQIGCIPMMCKGSIHTCICQGTTLALISWFNKVIHLQLIWTDWAASLLLIIYWSNCLTCWGFKHFNSHFLSHSVNGSTSRHTACKAFHSSLTEVGNTLDIISNHCHGVWGCDKKSMLAKNHVTVLQTKKLLWLKLPSKVAFNCTIWFIQKS